MNMKLNWKNNELNLKIFHTIETGYKRRTYVCLYYTGNHNEIIIYSECSKKDQFQKKLGRRIAARKLINFLRNSLGQTFLGHTTKEERRIIFEKLCPEFSKKGV